MKGRRRTLGVLAGLLVLAFLGVAIARDWSQVSNYDWHLEPAWLLGGCVLAMAAFASAGLGYGWVVRRLAPGSPGGWPMLRVWTLAQLGRYVPGTVLMVVGRLELGRELGVPRRVSLAASVYEQALLLATAAIGGALFVLLLSDDGLNGGLWLVALVPLGLALLHPRPFRALANGALRRLGREPLTDLLSARDVVAAVVWYAASNGLIGAAVWMLVRAAAGGEAGSVAFVGTAYLLSFTVAMLAFVIPSGLGIRDGLLALALAQNLPGGVAVAVSIGVRLALTLIELAFVGLVLAAERRFRPARPHYHGRRPAS